MSNDKDFKRLLNIILNNVKKISSPKEDILKILFYNNHLNIKEIQKQYENLNKSSMSINSIYNILNSLNDLNLIKTIEHSGIKKYELNIGLRHDHLICIKCKKIVEFSDNEITKLENIIGKKYGFKIEGHILLLEGICKKCQEKLK